MSAPAVVVRRVTKKFGATTALNDVSFDVGTAEGAGTLQNTRALNRVLRRKGYAGLRTDEVARVAKVSRGAQQYHFPTKDSLVLATAEFLMREGLERGQARARAAKSGGDPIEAGALGEDAPLEPIEGELTARARREEQRLADIRLERYVADDVGLGVDVDVGEAGALFQGAGGTRGGEVDLGGLGKQTGREDRSVIGSPRR